MLFAAPEGSTEALARVSEWMGREPERVVGARWRTAGWTSPRGLTWGEGDRYAVEGHVTGLPARDSRWGEPAAIAHTRGDFALFAQSGDDGLMLAAGRAGGYRPVYVASTSAGAFACTEMAPLVAALPEAAAIHVDYLASAIALEPSPVATATPYTSIERVPPGQAWTLRFTGHGRAPAIERASTVPPLRSPVLQGAPQELARCLREELAGAILRAVGSARSFAMTASGGVDSSTLLALACDLARRGALGSRPAAFCLDFEAPAYGDDRPFLRSLERHLGVAVQRVPPSAGAPSLRRSLVVDARPYTAGVGAMFFALGRLARQGGAEVLLTGVGGDNVVDGHATLLGDLARRGHPLRALAAALRMKGPIDGGKRARVTNFIVRPIVGRLLPRALRRTRRRRFALEAVPWAGPRLRRHLEGSLDRRVLHRPSLDWSPSEWYEAFLRMPIFDDLGEMRAQEEIAGGHVRRDPYFDDDLMRFAATLPPLSLLHGDFRRGLVREAMRGFLPEDVRLRTTKAYLDPAVSAMMTAAGGVSALGDLLDVRSLADLGLVEPRRFRAQVDDVVRGGPAEAGWGALWVVLATEAFLRGQGRPGGGSAAGAAAGAGEA